MRRAITFFVISVGLFVIAQLVVGFTGGSQLEVGIFSILVALFYVIFPVTSTKALALIPTIPLVVLIICIWVPGFLVIVSVCVAEFIFPAVLGYFFVQLTYNRFETTWVVIVIIVFITIWLLIRKHQVVLVKETWKFGEKLSQSIVGPIGQLIDNIWKSAEDLGKSLSK